MRCCIYISSSYAVNKISVDICTLIVMAISAAIVFVTPIELASVYLDPGLDSYPHRERMYIEKNPVSSHPSHRSLTHSRLILTRNLYCKRDRCYIYIIFGCVGRSIAYEYVAHL
jgi:hypothetical protein